MPGMGSGSGSWPAGRGRRIRGSPDRVIVWPCVRAGRVMRLGWWVGLPLLGALNGDSRACVQLSTDLSPLTVVQFQSLNSDLIKKIKKQILKKKGECANK